MSKNTRWALAIVGAAILIVAAVVIGTGKDSTDATQAPGPGETAATGPTGATGPVDGGATGATTGGATGDNSGGAAPGGGEDDGNGGSGVQNESGGAPATTSANTVLLRSGRVKTLTVNKGETVTILARSSTPAEVHVHGYDKSVDVEPGKTAKLTFKANIDGEFEIEFEQTGEKIGTLKVEP